MKSVAALGDTNRSNATGQMTQPTASKHWRNTWHIESLCN